MKALFIFEVSYCPKVSKDFVHSIFRSSEVWQFFLNVQRLFQLLYCNMTVPQCDRNAFILIQENESCWIGATFFEYQE
jgi:hypothetical protein